jgi:hypothetical protein
MRIAEGPQLQRPQPNNLRTSSPTEHAFVKIAGANTAVSTGNASGIVARRNEVSLALSLFGGACV